MQLLLLVHLNAHGNSATATKLENARNIKLQGAVSGNANFDGSVDTTIFTSIPISKITKILNDSGITVNVVLRKQSNIVYANFNIEIPKNTLHTIAFNSAIPTGFIPNENIQITISESDTTIKYAKLYIKSNGGITGVVNNSSENDSLSLIGQATYIID